MYSVEIDRSKRLLVINALQRVTAEEAKLVAQRIRELLHDVAPGFRVLADFRWLESMDPAAAPHVARIMAMYIAAAKRRFGPKVVSKLRGTIQADIFKEVQAQNETIFPIEASLRFLTDMRTRKRISSA